MKESWALIKPMLLVELALITSFILSAKLGWDYAAGIFLILAFIGLAALLWVIGTLLQLSGAKDIWKYLNSD